MATWPRSASWSSRRPRHSAAFPPRRWLTGAAICDALLQAGYLSVLRKATKTRQPEYRQVRRTGGLAPLERRVRAITDPNTGLFTVIGVHK